MEFGLFTEFHSPPGVTEAAAFDESLAQMKAAEDFGFDAVWLAEIHFQKDRSVLAAPLIVASALAACTQRVKIGIAGNGFLRPLPHPPTPADAGSTGRSPGVDPQLEARDSRALRTRALGGDAGPPVIDAS